MFLQDIKITFMEPCVAEPEKIRLKAELSEDITEVMPYLNAVIIHNSKLRKERKTNCTAVLQLAAKDKL